MNVTFFIIYILGWLITVYFIINKVKFLKDLYREITESADKSSKKEAKIKNKLSPKHKLLNILKHVILQERISNFRTKLMHTPLSFFGFIFLLSPLFLINPLVFQWIMDIFLLGALIGIILALARRYILKVPRIIQSSTKDRYFLFHVLILVNVISFTFLMYLNFPPSSPLLFSINNLIKTNFSTMAIPLSLVGGIIWLLSLYILFSRIEEGKIFHFVLAPINIINTDEKDFSIEHIDIEKDEKFGIDSIKDLEFKDFLEVFSCTECGRCQEACPAFLSNQPLSPKSILVNLIDSIDDYRNGKNGKSITEYTGIESIWSCTTCGACFNSCPVLINPFKKIIEIRKNLVMEKGELPTQLQDILNSIEVRNHPFKGVNIDRLQWTQKLDNVKIIENNSNEVDYIYWVGCAVSYNEQAQNVAVKLLKILNSVSIKVGILKNESCTGDPAKRIGNDYLFQIMAQNNIENLKKHNKKIITSCPHCYNTLKNEYPKLDSSFKIEIYHHSQVLADLIKKGVIRTKRKEDTITFHDPCYLGRQNGIIDEPRQILSKFRLKEMELSKKNSFCCGAGGGMYWNEQKKYPKINHQRLEQAIKVSNNIATGCPFCLLMLQDAVNTKGLKNQVVVKDIVEWIDVE